MIVVNDLSELENDSSLRVVVVDPVDLIESYDCSVALMKYYLVVPAQEVVVAVLVQVGEVVVVRQEVQPEAAMESKTRLELELKCCEW